MGPTMDEIEGVRARATLLVPGTEVERALQRLATEIRVILSGQNPLVLAVMTGGMVIAGQLLPRLEFSLRLAYLHATRYRDTTRGGALQWHYRPTEAIAGQPVLILDDILDEGFTLAAVAEACWQDGATSVHSAVLVEKLRPRTVEIQADFVGLRLPNRYLFGYGLDYKGYLRNAAGIYAIAESDL